MNGLSAALESAFRIRPGEARRVGLMFAYSMAVVSAFIVGRTVRDALFLSSYPVERLPLMYVGVAVCVSTFSLAYGRIADKLRRDRLILMTFAVASTLVVVGWAALVLSPASWMYPVLYVSVEIMGVVTIVQFWTFANDLMSSREGKRLFGIIGAGGVLSNVVCGFPLGAIAARVRSEHLLLMIVALFAAAALLVRSIAREARAELDARPRAPKPRTTASGAPFLGSPHLSLIAGVVVATVLTTTFIDYQLKVAAREAFSGRAHDLASFFGYFYGFTGVLSCMVQFFLTTRLLERFGIVVALLVLPTSLAIGSIGLLMVPLVPGLSAAALAKGAENVLRYTVNDSTMQLLYNPVPSDLRGRAKSFVDGVLKPLGIGVAGLTILLLSRSLDPESFGRALAAFDLVFAACWLAMVLAMRRRYVSSLLDTLRSRRLEPAAPIDDTDSVRVLSAALSGPDDSDVLHALELLPAVGREAPRLLRPVVAHRCVEARLRALELLAKLGERADAELAKERFSDPDPRVRRAAVETHALLAKTDGVASERALLEDPDLEVRAAAISGLLKYGGAEGRGAAEPALEALSSSPDAAGRKLAARVLGEIPSPSAADRRSLIKLLADGDLEVRRRAIAAAGAIGHFELVPRIIDALASQETCRAARQALVRCGREARAPALEALSRSSAFVKRELARVLAKIGDEGSVGALAELALEEDEGVRAAAVSGLAELALADPRHRLPASAGHRVLRFVALRAARDAESIVRLGLEPSDLLALALVERRRRCTAQVFRVLEARHPKTGLTLAEENLRAPEKTLRANALEVVENVVDGEESRIVMPLLDETALHSMTQAAVLVARALDHLGAEVMSREEKILALLRDPSPFVRSSAVRSLSRIDAPAFSKALPELSQDRDPLVEETLLATLSSGSDGVDASILRVLSERARESPSAFVREAGRSLAHALY
ncbi:MAG: HEAT repeat domain-containing protein [Deltaproteobacteria bacterium]|nr:HEAT repeat domain-containing protein [Deltaproteobacteria bacterium]